MRREKTGSRRTAAAGPRDGPRLWPRWWLPSSRMRFGTNTHAPTGGLSVVLSQIAFSRMPHVQMTDQRRHWVSIALPRTSRLAADWLPPRPSPPLPPARRAPWRFGFQALSCPSSRSASREEGCSRALTLVIREACLAWLRQGFSSHPILASLLGLVTGTRLCPMPATSRWLGLWPGFIRLGSSRIRLPRCSMGCLPPMRALGSCIT